MKRCGLYIRVSTDRQAKVEEGSLKNQDQLLTQHVEIKSKIGSEPWVIVDRYVDEGKSAKDIKGRPAYLRMVEDIKRGRIDTIICTALSRISRSTRDLLDMIDFFKQHEVDFICLKEDFDTTTAQGKCFVTIMGALNEFEREQTSERTRAAFLARAERGLWNGGQIIGYDLDPQRKGSLIPHPKEAEIVSRIFDTYLACGSILETAKRINAQGYRTRAYTGRRGVHHSEEPFCYSATQQILTNHAYIGRKEINKKIRHQPQDKLPEELRYRLVDAVWPAIVPAEKFIAAQKLMQVNLKHKYNGAKPSKHFYLLNGGILRCAVCGDRMEGRNAHGYRGKRVYHYYVCANPGCRFKLPEVEVERLLLELVRYLGSKPTTLGKIAGRLNARLQERLPRLSAQRQTYQEELQETNRKAQRLLEQYTTEANGGLFLKEALDQLAARRRELESRLATLAASESEITDRAMSEDDVRKLLSQFEVAFSGSMKPYQRKELVYKAIKRIELSGEDVRLGIDLSQRDATASDTPPGIHHATRVPHRPGEFIIFVARGASPWHILFLPGKDSKGALPSVDIRAASEQRAATSSRRGGRLPGVSEANGGSRVLPGEFSLPAATLVKTHSLDPGERTWLVFTEAGGHHGAWETSRRDAEATPNSRFAPMRPLWEDTKTD